MGATDCDDNEVNNKDNTTNNDSDNNDTDVGTQYLFIVRHGDRWDYQHPEWNSRNTSRIGDPPLSDLGHQQAREAGGWLGKTLKETCGITHSSQITWLTSPFLRCLQTSNEAISQLTGVIQDGDKIKMKPEYSVFEWDGKDGKWHKSLPPIQERIHYFPRLDTTYQSMFVPEIPEPRTAFHSRCDRAIHELNSAFPNHTTPQRNNKNKTNNNTAIIIVTHAAACIGLSRAAANLTLQDITPAAPCSVYGLTRKQQQPPQPQPHQNSTTTTVPKNSRCNTVWNLDAHDAINSWNGVTQHLSHLGTATVPWNHFADKKLHSGYTGPPTSRFAPDSLRT